MNFALFSSLPEELWPKGLDIQFTAELMSLLPEATEGGRGLEMMAFTFQARRRRA